MIPKELFAKIRRIEIRTKGLVNNVFGGEYNSAFKGRGISFAEVRPYQVGDDIRSIDWNVTARTGDAYVKIFEEEREQTLVLVVDISRSGNFASRNKFKREIAAEICAILGFSAIKNNDKVGLLLFSSEVELYVPPKSGRRHVLRLIRDLFAHMPARRGTNIGHALEFVQRTLRRRSIVLIISDFFDEGYQRPLRLLSRKHDTVAIRLHDRRDIKLPAMGILDLADPETGQILTLDTSSRRVRSGFEAHAQSQRNATRNVLRGARVDHVSIVCEEDYTEPLMRFFRQRAGTA